MNQISKNAPSSSFDARMTSNRRRSYSNWLFALLMFVAVGAFHTSSLFAQGHFAPPPVATTASAANAWTPPAPAASREMLMPPPEVLNPPGHSFPETPHAFTGGGDADDESASNSSFDATLDSTASIIADLSENFGGDSGVMGGWLEKIQSMFGSSDVGRMLGSLALVLGIYFAFVWLMRKVSPGGNRELPREVVSVMGQVPFGPRRNLQLVRLGSKLVLLLNSQDGTQPIGEISDPLEVEYLTSLCPGKTSSSSLGAIHHAARRLTESNTPQTSAPKQAVSSTSLTQVIKMLENASKQGGAVFEA